MLHLRGHRLYGACERVGDTHVATLFTHHNFMPMRPIESVIVGRDRAGARASVAIPLHPRSVRLTYARGFGVILSIAILAWSIAEVKGAFTRWEAIEGAAWGVLPVALTTAAFLLAGRLSADAKAQRLVYKGQAGWAVDVALLGGVAANALAQKLRAFIAKRASHADAGYRDRAGAAPRPADVDYRAIALDPGVTDLELLEAAFTLARLDEVTAVQAQRKIIAADRARIWGRIRERRPGLADEVRRLEPSARRVALVVAGLVPLAATIAGLASLASTLR